MSGKTHRILNLAFKTILVLISTVVFLLLLLTTLLIIPPTGNYITQKVVRKAEKELNTDISVGSIHYTPPAKITVNSFYIQGTDKDTLIWGDHLAVSVKLLPLLKHHLVIDYAEIENAGVRLIRSRKDSLFNFAFNTKKVAVPDTSGTRPMKVSVGKVMLDHIRFFMDDAVSHNKVSVNLGHFNLDMDEIDLQQNLYSIKDFELENTAAVITTGTSTFVSDDTSDTSNLIVKLRKQGVLKNCRVHYTDATGSLIDARKINLGIRDNTFDLGKQFIALKSLELLNSTLRMQTVSPIDTTALKKADSIPGVAFNFPEWQIKVDDISLENNNFSFDRDKHKDTSVFDPNHIHITSLSASLNNFEVNKSGVSVDLTDFSTTLGNQFRIKNLSTGLSVQENSVRIDPFELTTTGSSFSGKIQLSYNSLHDLLAQQNIKIIRLDQDAKVNLNDMVYFMPELSDSFPQLLNDNTIINVSVMLNGKLDAVNISKFELSVENTVDLKLIGVVNGIPDVDSLRTDFEIEKLWLNYAQLKPYFPKINLPQSLILPDTMQVFGKGSGSLQDVRADFTVKSYQGVLMVKASYKNDTVQNIKTIATNIDIPDYQLGVLLNKPDTIGSISAKTAIKAAFRGDKMSRLNGEMKISSIGYSGYTYKDISADAEQRNDTIFASINTDDPNVRITSDAWYLRKDSVSNLSLSLNIDYLDMQSVKLRNEDLRLSGRMNVDLSGKFPDDFNGSLVVKKLIVNRNNTVYYPDSLSLIAQVGDTNKITLSSPFAEAEYSGTMNPLYLAELLNNYIPFSPDTVNSVLPGNVENRNFKFRLSLENDPVYTQLVLPDLKQLKNATFTASFSQDKGLDADLSLPYLEYGSVVVDSFYIIFHSGDAEFDYQSGFSMINSGSVTLPATRISGYTTGKQLVNTFDLPADDKQSKYFVQAVITQADQNNLNLKILSDSLILNRSSWEISPDNVIVLGGNSTSFQHIILSHNSDTLRIVSDSDERGADTEIRFSNFNLKTLASLAEYNGAAPSAVLNGMAAFGKQDGRTTFTSDLIISDLNLFGDVVFNRLDLKAEQKSENEYDFKIDMQNNGQTSTVNGSYNIGEQTSLNMDINLNRFALSPFAPLVESQFHTLKGELSGRLKLSGSTDTPVLNGNITFDSLQVNPVMLNSPLTMNNATVLVQSNVLQFKETTIRDKNSHKAVVNGTVAYRPDNRTSFNLNFKATDFMFVNVDKDALDLYHGTLITDVDATLTGDLIHPVVKLNTTIKEGSDLHFTVPESSVNPGEDEGVAEFVNTDTSMVTRVSDQSLKYSGILPDVTANISFQDYIPVTILIDPVSKEQLQLSGKGDLSLRLRGNTEPSLSGRYTINNGSYTLLLYNVFRRTFMIRQGSYLLWSGDVLKPKVNMVAAFEVKTSPIGLVASELNAGNQSLAQYRNPIPFNVVMNLDGDLLSPDINFDIKTPPGKADALVTEKLNRLNSDESAVNKQVLSLLIFKSFMNQNVGGTDVAYRLNNTARNGLSNILSNSFNQFAQNYIKGINLTLDVESRAGYNNSTSGNTDLVFGASKSLLSDRLTIEVGSSINVENENNKPPGANGLAGDFKVDYKISKDGALSVQAFRSSEYEDVLVGDVTKTGLALKLSKAFTHFNELFKRDKNKTSAEGNDQ